MLFGGNWKFEGFKAILDVFLSEIPDYPFLNGFHNGNNDMFNMETNSIPLWIRNMKLRDWMIPDAADTINLVSN